MVASFTDAWIETFAAFVRDNGVSVASFTDAWIETLNNLSLKYGNNVASFTDAWIETLLLLRIYLHNMSHLLQMRGLKL